MSDGSQNSSLVAVQDTNKIEILNWANIVYSDPLKLISRLSNELIPAQQLSSENEQALYLDWQSRDAEVGYKILEPHRNKFLRAVSAFGSSIIERRREIALTKVRLDSIEQISSSEPVQPNLEQKYSSKVVKSLRREHNRITREILYLKRFLFSLEAVDQLLSSSSVSEKRWTGDYSEPRFRLFSLAVRGYLKVSAFSRRFPKSIYPLPEITTIGTLTGVLVGQASISTSNDNSDILIEIDTANYLLHCLESIALLIDQVENQPLSNYSETDWPSLMLLLRAITELFYFCNFELPHSVCNLLLDYDQANKLLLFRPEQRDWQAVDESDGQRLRREAGQAARLMYLYPSLLNCQDSEEIDKFLKNNKELPKINSPKYYESYLSAGLAQFEVNEFTNKNKFHITHRFIDRLLNRVMERTPDLKQRFNTEIGGPFDTLTAIALLDKRLLSMPSQVYSDNNRYLARFWKIMSKRRPSTLLGRHYSKEINNILHLMGEASPERSTYLSIYLTTVYKDKEGSNLATKTGTDFISNLTVTDQVRVISLLNTSWSFAEEFLSCLHSISNSQNFESIITKLYKTISNNQDKIVICFNRKWAELNTPIWSLIRTSAPYIWYFWNVLASKQDWLKATKDLSPDYSLSLLLRALCDIARLKLLFEICSPKAGQQQEVEAETAIRSLLESLSYCLMIGGIISDTIAETFNYYYEQNSLHDVVLAFTSSFVNYLINMRTDLDTVKDSQELDKLLVEIVDAMYLFFPGLKKASDSKALTKITLGGENSAVIELYPDNSEVVLSKNGVNIHLQQREWLELVQLIKSDSLT